MNGNENIMHVEAIEGLLSEVNRRAAKIVPTSIKEVTAKEQLLEDINLIQKDTLHQLRILCEGD